MINFDNEEMQTAFNKCHFRKEFDGVDICGGMCSPCIRIIESGQCSMLSDYFTKHNLTTAMSFRCKEEKKNEY